MAARPMDRGAVGRPAWLRYGAAIGFVLAAFGVKRLFAGQLASSPFLLLPFSALLAAWFGGLGPGLLATLLSAVLANEFFLDPMDTPRDRTLQLAAFGVQGVVVSLMAHLLGRARAQAGKARSHAESADRQRFRALENISDSFFSLDPEWRIVYANRNFLANYSRGRAEEVIGRSIWEIYPEMAGTDIEMRYRRAMETRVPEVFEMRSYLSPRWFRIVMEPTEDGGLSVSATDFSELKATEEVLRAAKEDAERARAEAEEANRIKDQFLATLSHELRTPVNAIAGWTQILRSGQLDPEKTARALDVIERNARVQAQLIGDLLDISRIISGKLRLETRPVWPAEVVDAALAAVLPAAESKGVRVERVLDPGAGPVLADPDRLQQIVSNLLGNAVKFTPRDGRVEIRLEERNGEVRLQVSDSGQGIERDLLAHVFDSFWQADASTTRHQSGLGLGLAIVRQLVGLHGGHVEAASEGTGLGATFTVFLPLLQPQREAEILGVPVEPALASRPSVPLSGLHLLVVEDDEATLDALTELLSLQGATVTPAASVDQALKELAKRAPDVLVSDIAMPERDGYDLIRTIRAQGHDAETLPAIAVTAFAGPEDRQRALAAGFQLHLAKPVDPRELTRLIASLAGGSVASRG
jgi:signal transduction histidine kinase/ActR/RegA family two-component response regulator